MTTVLPDLIATLRQNMTELEAVGVLVGVLAAWLTSSALRRAARYYARRHDAPVDHGEELDLAERADFLTVDVRVEAILCLLCVYLLYASAIAALTPPPQGYGPYNWASFSVAGFRVVVSVLVIGVKIVNRQTRERIYGRIDRHIRDLTLDQARTMTRPERHALKNRLQRAENAVWERDRAIDALVDENDGFRRRLGLPIDADTDAPWAAIPPYDPR